MMIESYDWDNMTALVKQTKGKKFMFMRDSWDFGSYGIINKLILKSPEDKYGKAVGHIHYKNGNTQNGDIGCAGCYSWRIVKVLEQDVEIIIDGKKAEFIDIDIGEKNNG